MERKIPIVNLTKSMMIVTELKKRKENISFHQVMRVHYKNRRVTAITVLNKQIKRADLNKQINSKFKIK